MALNLHHNAIDDIMPIQNMHQLKRLDISNNKIKDMRILASLPSKPEICPYDNPISDDDFYPLKLKWVSVVIG